MDFLDEQHMWAAVVSVASAACQSPVTSMVQPPVPSLNDRQNVYSHEQ